VVLTRSRLSLQLWSPLHWACAQQSYEKVRLLGEHGRAEGYSTAKVCDANLPGLDGKTAVHATFAELEPGEETDVVAVKSITVELIHSLCLHVAVD
jgi:hypothetical protein